MTPIICAITGLCVYPLLRKDRTMKPTMNFEYWCERFEEWRACSMGKERVYEPNDDGSVQMYAIVPETAHTLEEAWKAIGSPEDFSVIGGNGSLNIRCVALDDIVRLRNGI